jgi:hypothetical protein
MSSLKGNAFGFFDSSFVDSYKSGHWTQKKSNDHSQWFSTTTKTSTTSTPANNVDSSDFWKGFFR